MSVDRVYAVSSGEYSSYRVEAVFEVRELAEAHVLAMNDPDGYGAPFIEEFRMFDRLPVKVTWYGVNLMMREDGSYPPEPKVYEREDWEYDAPDGVSMRPRTEVLYQEPYETANASSPTIPPTMAPGSYTLRGHCLDEAALSKIASDTVAQWKAQNYTLHNAKPWADQSGLL